MKPIYWIVPFAPLLGSIVAGVFGWMIGRQNAHRVTIFLMLVSFFASLKVFFDVSSGLSFNGNLYTWSVLGQVPLAVGFLIDPLTVIMMVTVTFISLLVHIYSIGYMHDDPGYCRFFSYISLFTFAMLMLVMANNFVQLFFGWEGVGLVSYLLIGFWFQRESAVFANLKAFLVNRVGDIGFLLGMALVFVMAGRLDYASVFSQIPVLSNFYFEIFPGVYWHWATAVGCLFFIGAMAKSAQVPLHIWLPDSMEGPTPISALIHAATMVTAGIFMFARLSPIYESAPWALALVLIAGAITAFFLGLVALVQHDIKRVIAYSTISQLGYMAAAAGASAYTLSIFHLFTHAFFKALLFLAAGSVIVAMHHEQDMRHMGGLRRFMPITYLTALVGSLALCGIPPFAGFFSKDAILEAVAHANVPGAPIAYILLLGGVFVTAFYTFRMMMLTFHGTPRFDSHHIHPHESPFSITFPLILLAISSLIAGFGLGPMGFGDFFSKAITIAPGHEVVQVLAEEYHGPLAFIAHGFMSLALWLAIFGIAFAVFLYGIAPKIAPKLSRKFAPIAFILERKYGLDAIFTAFLPMVARLMGQFFWKLGDVLIIDKGIVMGTARNVLEAAKGASRLQTGYFSHYAFAMIIGVVVLVGGLIYLL
jgi:NADH-quinone oxidoreductase subunit L